MGGGLLPRFFLDLRYMNSGSEMSLDTFGQPISFFLDGFESVQFPETSDVFPTNQIGVELALCQVVQSKQDPGQFDSTLDDRVEGTHTLL